jgi:curved DNA-binding protein CbpA
MTLSEIKSQFHKLALIYHPDRPTGDVVTMQQIVAAYEWVRANHGTMTAEERGHIRYDIDPEILAKAVRIKNVDASLSVIIAGAWIWVEGATIKGSDEIRALLKQEGFRFSRDKLAWYYAGCKSFSRKPQTLGYIYGTYGRHDVAQYHTQKLGA